ncbi:uncharacterized protein TRAVEDRAFT_49336 [Trametes versicolor FP-101664 SS1]|uniref:uncharacterized protein n=1 Tax=Trametes versicolor (strain FP-101664) TaxID=717944 RepID=UPI0004622AEE|nr:uncharacterized protein TRAVEDRAFT_49336 [Trametes versicolor FP-101664 SS1]EIW56509.1 hypothetical protein TRAVEDRAFT_49336 [Trametes versicolor FP-101664 SS1]
MAPTCPPVVVDGLLHLAQELHILPTALFEASPANPAHDPLYIGLTGCQVKLMKRSYSARAGITAYRVFIVLPTDMPMMGLTVYVHHAAESWKNRQAIELAVRCLAATEITIEKASVDVAQWPNMVAF